MKKLLDNFLNKKTQSYYNGPEEELNSLTPEKELKFLRKENKQLKEDFFEQARNSVKTRRSIRKYSGKEIDEKTLYDILDSALNAPAAGNLQNYRIVVVKDQKNRSEIGKIALNQCWLSEAPVVLVIVRDDTEVVKMYPQDGTRYSIQNSAAFIQNILTLAHAADLGACWVEACEDGVLKDFLGIPESNEIDAIIPLGYPREVSKQEKQTTTNVVYFEKFKNRKK